MQQVVARIAQVSATTTPVLITGETGVGKEIVAREIHRRSSRAGGRFVAVNCGGLPEGLQISQLFGHCAGAFTGAVKSQAGLVEAAGRGTLFLDEVGDLPPAAQVMLLRFLQDGEYLRLGDSATHHSDARVLAATDWDLEALMAQGRFRRELYFRLSVTKLHVPPLRERREDLSELTEQLLAEIAHKDGRGAPAIGYGVAEKLQSHSWPGNVRELKSVLTQAWLRCQNGRIDVSDVAFEEPAGRKSAEAQPKRAGPQRFEEAEREFQIAYFSELLRRTHGGVKEAAELADLSERGLRKRLETLRLDPGQFRTPE